MAKSCTMLTILGFLLVGSCSAVSPVGKVIELLGSCKAKIESDLAAEGKAMEAFTDFCDNTLKDTDYAIKTSTSQIADLKATMEDTTAQIEAAGAEMEELGSNTAQKGAEIAEAKKVRATAKADFESNEKQVLASIDELSRAIVKLKSESLIQVKSVDSKKAQNARLVQSLQAQAPVFERLLAASYIPVQTKKQLSAFLQQGTDEADQDDLSFNAPQGTASNYEDHSGGIMSTVEDMESKAQGQLADLRKAEMQASFSADMVERGLNEEVRVIKDKMASTASRKSGAEEALGKAKGELSSTETSKAKDEALLAATTEECRVKAAEWETRQKSAAGEMGAIAKATEILEGGVKVFAQTKAVTQRKAKKNSDDDDEDKADALQDKRDQVSGYLRTMSHKYNSFALSQLAMSAGQDPFGKVKGMIESMIEKLLEDANKEATQKAFCDTETSKTRKSLEDKTMSLDTLSARVDEASTKRAELGQSIKDLMGEVAELDKASAEATAIRSAEHEEYLKSSKDFKDSADAVVAAISVLKSYYEGGAFVQVAAKSQSLKSKQPSQGDTANTIIEVLEMSEEDFTRLLAEAESDEQSSAAEFKTFSQDTRVSKASKEAEVANKESEVKSLTVAVNNHKEDKGGVAKELAAVQSYLDKLKPQCEEKAMSYEEKKARRETEVDGLKEALSIMAGESVPAASLVQKKHNLRRVQRSA